MEFELIDQCNLQSNRQYLGMKAMNILDFLDKDSHQGRETFEGHAFGQVWPGVARHMQVCLDLVCVPLVGPEIWTY